MIFVKNWQFFYFFILSKIGQEKVFYDILDGKKRLSRLQTHQVKKVEKLKFFQRV